MKKDDGDVVFVIYEKIILMLFKNKIFFGYF